MIVLQRNLLKCLAVLAMVVGVVGEVVIWVVVIVLQLNLLICLVVLAMVVGVLGAVVI